VISTRAAAQLKLDNTHVQQLNLLPLFRVGGHRSHKENWYCTFCLAAPYFEVFEVPISARHAAAVYLTILVVRVRSIKTPTPTQKELVFLKNLNKIL
jgi:hypothetical protein